MKILKYLLVLFLVLLSACSSTRLVNSKVSYKGEFPRIQKMLLIGMTPDKSVRQHFENSLKKAFKKNDVISFTSVESNSPVLSGESTENQLNLLEKKLLDEGYDAVLISKIIRVEKRVNLGESLARYTGNYRSFKSDYYSNQGIFDQEEIGRSNIYHTQTSIYTLPKNRQRELLWEGAINLKNPRNLKNATDQYIELLISRLKWDGILEY